MMLGCRVRGSADISEFRSKSGCRHGCDAAVRASVLATPAMHIRGLAAHDGRMLHASYHETARRVEMSHPAALHRRANHEDIPRIPPHCGGALRAIVTT